MKVIAGNYRGTIGSIIAINADTHRVTVEEVNLVSKHKKPTAANPQAGEIVQEEAPVHISNVALVDQDGTTIKVGRKKNDNGQLKRYSKRTGNFLDQ